jgi:hypothetical protein
MLIAMVAVFVAGLIAVNQFEKNGLILRSRIVIWEACLFCVHPGFRPGPGAGTWFTGMKGASSPTGAGLAHCPGGLPCRHENRIPYRRERRSVREVQGGHLFYGHPVP